MPANETRKFWLTDDLFERILPFLLNEVKRQTIIHKRVVRLNILCYTDLKVSPANPTYIPHLWIMLFYAIGRAIKLGHIAEYQQDDHWLHLPDAAPADVSSAFETKRHTYNLWTGRASDEAAGHAEQVIRAIFKEHAYRLPPNKFELEHPSTGEICVPDVFTFAPVQTGGEIKNISSDVISDPRPLVGKPKQDLHTRIDRHFRLCAANGIHPLLIAPRVDPSFVEYASQYKGLHCEMLYQLMPPHHATLCKAIEDDLLFKHVLAVDSEPPFPPELEPLINWVHLLPDLLRRYT